MSTVDVSIYRDSQKGLMCIDFTPQAYSHLTFTLQKNLKYKEFEEILCNDLHYVTTSVFKTPHARDLWRKLIKQNWKELK